MGIIVEFNPDLALRDINFYKRGERKLEECLPEILEENKTFSFLKEGQRNYWLHGELPLLETKGGGDLSAPLASIRILEVTHFKDGGKLYTKGKYEIVKILTKDEIYFNGINKIDQ